MPHALIIDDVPANIAHITQLLAQSDFRYTTIHTLDALQQALHNPDDFDVVLAHLNLNSMTGYDVLTILRQQAVTAPIVACSIYADEIDRAREMGFDGFIGLPLQPAHFSQQIERILAGEAVWER